MSKADNKTWGVAAGVVAALLLIPSINNESWFWGSVAVILGLLAFYIYNKR